MRVHFRRIPRYTLVAVGCALLHNVILILVDALGGTVLLCQAASAAVLLPVGFLLQAQVTFECERSLRGFARYSALLLTNFPIAIAVLWLTHDLLALSMWIAAPISSVALFCWNYATTTWALAPRNRVAAHG